MRYIIVFLLLFFVVSTVQASSPDGYLIIPEIYLYKSIILIPDSDVSPDTFFYDLATLNYGVGHLQYTSWKTTEGGRTVLVGHTPGAFSNLKYLTIGDSIIYSMGDTYYTMEIFEKYITPASDGGVIYSPSDTYEIVLITCTENPNERLIIKAR